jgi:hypothetical protein
MVANLRLTGAQTDPREESDIRVNTNNLNQIICASTKLGGAQPMSYSIDGGVTWSQASLTEVTGDARQGDPTIDWTSDGTAWTVTIGIDTASDLVCRTFKSVDQGATWSFDSTVATTQTAMDRQALWIDHGAASPHKDNMYLIWHNGAPCFVSVRAGPGGAWSAPLQISGAETTGTAIGSDIKTNAKGEVFAFWPDTVSQNLFVAKSIDGGGSFAKPVSIAVTNTGGFINVPAQNGRSCLIYLSGGAFLTPTNSYVYAIWHDLAGGAGCNSAANAPGGSVTSTCKTRIFFSRSTDGGVTWSTPVKINDQPTQAGQNPNDQFFARLAVDQVSGVLVVVYYDTINDPGRLKTNLWMQASTDHGATWSGAAQVANAQTDETVAGAQANFQYGDYIGLTGHEGNFFACWTDRRSGGVEEIWGAPIQTSSIAFVFGQSTYSVDQVAAGQIFGPAYWIQVSGFSNDQLGLQQPLARSHRLDLPRPLPQPFPDSDPARRDLGRPRLADHRLRPPAHRRDRQHLQAGPPDLPLSLPDHLSQQGDLQPAWPGPDRRLDPAGQPRRRAHHPHRRRHPAAHVRREPALRRSRPQPSGRLSLLAQLRPSFLQDDRALRRAGLDGLAVQRHHDPEPQ